MNVPFKLIDTYYQTTHDYREQGDALGALYYRVFSEYFPLEDYELLTRAKSGEFVVVPKERVRKWITDFQRSVVFYRSIGLDPLGIEELLASYNILLETGKYEYPKDLLDRELYFCILTYRELSLLGKGATEVDSILSALTRLISRTSRNEILQCFWSDFWVPPSEQRIRDLFRKYQNRQPVSV